MKIYFSIASNTIFQVLSRAATATVGLIVIRLITDSFGLDGYGQYQMVLAYVTLWWILTDFGLNAVVVREMAAQEKNLQPLFSSLLTLRTLLGFILLGLSLLIALFLPYSSFLKLGIFIASITILAQGIAGSAHAVFQVKLRYGKQFYANLGGSLVFLSLVFLSLRQGWGILGLIGAFTSGYLVMMFVSLFFLRSFVSLSFGKETGELKRIIKVTIPFGLALLLSLATFKIDAILMSVLSINGWSNEAAVGIYQLSYKVFELVLVVPIFFMNVMYPIMVRHFEESLVKFKETFFKTLGLLMLAALTASAATYFFSPAIIGVLAKGKDFAPSAKVLQIFTLQFPIFYLTAPLMWTVMVFKKQSHLIWVYLIAFLFNFTLNYLLIPRYAFWAAAWITGITEVLILAMLVGVVIFYWRQAANKSFSFIQG